MTKLYNHGLAVGRSIVTNATPSRRGSCSGWSDQVARRNMRFLWSIDSDALSGLVGYAFTWTVKICPDDPKELARAIKLTLEDLKRGNRCGPPAELIHYVIEWQKRGVPHIHGVIYYTPENDATFARSFSGFPTGAINYLTYRWLHQSDQWESSKFGQFIHPIYDSCGWSKYVAKHASRGAKHYQRASDSLPPQWRGKTGRMWGKRGDWPVIAPLDVHFLIRQPTLHDVQVAQEHGVEVHQLPGLHDPRGFAAFRRLVRSYQVAEARSDLFRSLAAVEQARTASMQAASPTGSAVPAHSRAQSGRSVGQPERAALRLKGSLKSFSYVRRMLKCSDPLTSSHRGLSRWCPLSVSKRFVELLRLQGFIIHVT